MRTKNTPTRSLILAIMSSLHTACGLWNDGLVHCKDDEFFKEGTGKCAPRDSGAGETDGGDGGTPARDGAMSTRDGGPSDGEAEACVTQTWYADSDGDGFGDATDSKTACTAPTGYVANSDDPYPACAREKAPADCTPGALRCASGTVGDREICTADTKFPGCTDWKPSAACGADAAVCSGDGECGKCSQDSDCEAFDQVCDVSTGACAQCTGTKASKCGGDVCDSIKRTCATGVKPGDADFCDRCVSDAHCRTDALCMPTSFDGSSTGYSCLPKRDPAAGPQSSCITAHRPYVATLNAGVGDPIASVDGTTIPVCRLRVTSCQALNDYSSKPCSSANDDATCGVALLDDAVCAPVPADTVFRCSTPCLSDDDCKVGSTCTGSGYCSL